MANDRKGRPIGLNDIVQIEGRVMHDPDDGSGVITVNLTELPSEKGQPTALRVLAKQVDVVAKGTK